MCLWLYLCSRKRLLQGLGLPPGSSFHRTDLLCFLLSYITPGLLALVTPSPFLIPAALGGASGFFPLLIWHCPNIPFGFSAFTSLGNQSPVLNSLCLKGWCATCCPAGLLTETIPFSEDSTKSEHSVLDLTSPHPISH